MFILWVFLVHVCVYVCVYIYEAFHVSSPGAAREREIMLFSACVWRAKMNLKKIIPKWFRCIFPQLSDGAISFSKIFNSNLKKT